MALDIWLWSPGRLFGIVISLVVTLPRSDSTSIMGDDMWKPKTFASNYIRGDVCLSFANLIPTCGWKMLFTSTMPISSSGIWSIDTNTVEIDDSSFYMLDDGTNKDFTSSQGSCMSANLYGTFSTEPTISVHFVCVCNSDYPNIDCAFVEPYVGYSLSNPSQIFMKHQGHETCYEGTQLTSKTIRDDSSALCSLLCTSVRDCVGVNMWADTSRCDLVLDTSQGLVLGTASGCQYWKVLWKA